MSFSLLFFAFTCCFLFVALLCSALLLLCLLLLLVWLVLVALGCLLAGLGPVLAALGALLAALGLLLGRSWALLGGSWEALGRSWGDLGTTCKNHPKIDPKNDRFRLPKGRPEGAKIEPQTDQNRRQKSMRKKHLFKIVLEPSWSDLGSFWRPSWEPKIV